MAIKYVKQLNSRPRILTCAQIDIDNLPAGNHVPATDWTPSGTDMKHGFYGILESGAVINVNEDNVLTISADGNVIFNATISNLGTWLIIRINEDDETASISWATYEDRTIAPVENYYILSSAFTSALYDALISSAVFPEEVIPDPYAEHKPSEIINENKGEWDFPDEIVTSPEEPTDNVTDTGFITCWKVSEPTLQALASYMWTPNFFDNIIKNFGDPIDTLLSLHLLPIEVPTKSGLLPIKAGNVETGVSAYKVGKQFVTFDCGTIHISEQFGSYLDYSPFTKFEIVLPFMSTYALDPDIIVGHDLHLYYRIDVATGACLAFIDVDGRNIYSFSGNCAVEMPITSANYSQLYQTIASMATSAITRGVSSGASVPATKTMSGKGGHAGQILSGIVGGVEGAGSSAMSNINNMKPEYQKVGALGSSLALMSPKKPFLIVTYPNICAPENLNKFVGYPSYVTMPLSTCKGYTEIDHIELNGINATDYEMQEIENYLKSGVIF